MITRLVCMQFRPEEVDTFLEMFRGVRDAIQRQDGCHDLKIWREEGDSSTFFTYSVWESEDHLERYRQSELFRSTWSRTKPLFREPARAWTVSEAKGL